MHERTKPSFLNNPVFCCDDVLHLFFILKYFFFSFIILFVERERERERERENVFFFFSKITVCF